MSELRFDVEKVFHMASCAECGGGALPWYDADERDKWATAHAEANGHHVSKHTEMRGRSADGETTLHIYPLTELAEERNPQNS